MIDKIEDLVFTEEQTEEQIDQMVKDKLGIGFAEMAEHLSQYIEEKAEELAQNYVTVVAYGDYGKILEGDDKIAQFFRQEATKPDSWVPFKLLSSTDPKYPNMVEVAFINRAVDEGDSMMGYVFVSFAGVVRHSFVVGDP
jgi:hypothetical protein